ncbi:MAG: hypothetical protein QF893_14495 [Alphaproteobacteria bacterium]|jgi:hypothetical protein|nr:hypothetical protein [Alphaproteobacteria bacterium]
MIVEWEKGLFWLWLAGAIGWIIAITYFLYGETNAFSLHLGHDELAAYILLYAIPPVLTFIVYLFVLWIGRRITAKDDQRWDRQASREADRRFRRRG